MSEPKRFKRATMSEIAARAGVSRATVSIILSSQEGTDTRFKPETVARVRQIAREMGYQMNLMALSLRNPHPSFFGLILRGASPSRSISWHHQAFEGLFQVGVTEAARAARLYPVLATQYSPETGEALEHVTDVLDGGVFGAIVRTPSPVLVEPIRRRMEQGYLAVIAFPDDTEPFPTNVIDMDNRQAGRLAGQLLHGAGRRRWLIVRDDLPRQALRHREEGAAQIAAAVGASLDVLKVPSHLDEPELITRLIPDLKRIRPDGIYAASSVCSVATLLAADAAGLRVREDTCLVGCDASLWRPPGFTSITSVDMSWFMAGEAAVQQMIKMRESEHATFGSITLPAIARPGGTCPGAEGPLPDGRFY